MHKAGKEMIPPHHLNPHKSVGIHRNVRNFQSLLKKSTQSGEHFSLADVYINRFIYFETTRMW